jgi:hypothetical protein
MAAISTSMGGKLEAKGTGAVSSWMRHKLPGVKRLFFAASDKFQADTRLHRRFTDGSEFSRNPQKTLCIVEF